MPPPDSPARTPRQRITELLEREERSFEALRQELALTVRGLEDHLRHVERSVRRAGKRLAVEPPRCLDCDYVFRGRERVHFHKPSRCPECRGEGVTDARLRIVSH